MAKDNRQIATLRQELLNTATMASTVPPRPPQKLWPVGRLADRKSRTSIDYGCGAKGFLGFVMKEQ